MATKDKHPKGLMVLFFTEMWERFSYYGMRALLVLYLTSKMMHGGFNLVRADALDIYAIFTGLVYLTPMLGGFLADRFLGQRKAVYIGAFLIAMGQFLLAASEFGRLALRHESLSLGLGLLIAGNGFFKPNISTIVGQLYAENDPRRDSAFTIFYMGINVGALASPLIAGTLGEVFGWYLGFGSAAVGMLFSIFWFYFQSKHLGAAGLPPKLRKKDPDAVSLTNKDRSEIFYYIVVVTIIVWGLIKGWNAISDDAQDIIIVVMAIIGSAILLYIISSNTKSKDEWSRIGAIFILCLFNIFFWSGFEQAGGTFNLFAEHNTNRMIFSWEFPASYFQSVNPVFIIILAPLFSVLWMRLSNIGKDPRTPMKFVWGLVFLGVGFVVMSMASFRSVGGVLVSPVWLLMVYFFHTTGELCLSPIGLSMVTKLSPPKIVSVMMGVWFASIALAEYMAGILEALLKHLWPEMNLYVFLTITSFSGVIMLLGLTPLLNRMMKGIH